MGNYDLQRTFHIKDTYEISFFFLADSNFISKIRISKIAVSTIYKAVLVQKRRN